LKFGGMPGKGIIAREKKKAEINNTYEGRKKREILSIKARTIPVEIQKIN